MECQGRRDTSNKRANWNHLTVVQKVPEQQTGKHEIKKIQKIAILDTAHILWEVLM